MPQKTVLVVDDEKSIVEMISMFLSSKGVNVIVAHNGNEAVELAQKNSNISLVLCDIRMPSMGGAELFDKLHQKVPAIIFMSGYSDVNLVELQKRGAKGFLLKPFTVKEFFDMVGPIIKD